ncbi:MAG TPA: hypothetical protein V6D27_12495, partial [Vampirovibrionales bacterium]
TYNRFQTHSHSYSPGSCSGINPESKPSDTSPRSGNFTVATCRGADYSGSPDGTHFSHATANTPEPGTADSDSGTDCGASGGESGTACTHSLGDRPTETDGAIN